MSTDNLESHLLDVCTRARRAGYAVANLCADEKNAALRAMADLIVAEREFLETENQRDINAARDKGMSAALIDRLTLNVKRIKSMAEGLHAVAALDDPVGALLDQVTRPSGIEVTKVRVPIGVICMVYESRPNVTADAAGLCLKAGNAVILRGGSEAIHSNIAIARLLQRALVQTGIHQDAIQLVETTDRAAVDYLLKASKYIDLVIPRGGESLIRKVVETSRIPVLKHYDGVCHTYIAGSADKEKAVSVSLNAKAQRPGTCNAMETLLVDKAVAAEIIPPLFAKMREAGVELRGCEATRAIDPAVKPATEEDWRTEYLDLILSVKIVNGVDEAINFINEHGSHHSDAIIAEDRREAAHFMQNVDSAAVFVNTSTRFNDGFEFGLGAEIGISTDKLHARGPVGLEGLTTYKYLVRSNGAVRS